MDWNCGDPYLVWLTLEGGESEGDCEVSRHPLWRYDFTFYKMGLVNWQGLVKSITLVL